MIQSVAKTERMNKIHIASIEHLDQSCLKLSLLSYASIMRINKLHLLHIRQFSSELLLFVTENALADVTANYLSPHYKVTKGKNGIYKKDFES